MPYRTRYARSWQRAGGNTQHFAQNTHVAPHINKRKLSNDLIWQSETDDLKYPESNTDLSGEYCANTALNVTCPGPCFWLLATPFKALTTVLFCLLMFRVLNEFSPLKLFCTNSFTIKNYNNFVLSSFIQHQIEDETISMMLSKLWSWTTNYKQRGNIGTGVALKTVRYQPGESCVYRTVFNATFVPTIYMNVLHYFTEIEEKINKTRNSCRKTTNETTRDKVNIA